MIGLLRAIFDALRLMLAGQQELWDRAAKDKADLDTQLAAQSAAIEHLRALIEDDSIPTTVGAPTFTPTGGNS